MKTIIGIKKKLFILQHHTKWKSVPKEVDSALNQRENPMNSHLDMNTSSPIAPNDVSTETVFFELPQNAAQ